MNKRYIVMYSILYFSVILLSYGIWVYFSYLIVPFKQPSDNLALRYWHFDGYYKIKPGTYKNDKYKCTINSKGFRGLEFSEKGRAFRIICLGESSTWGPDSNDGQTWPARLEEYLIKDGFEVEVINCGIIGAKSDNHLAMLKNELIKYSPDLILYYAGFNDYIRHTLERYPGPKLWPDGRWHFFKAWCKYKKIQLRFILLNLTGFDIEPIIPWPDQWMNKYKRNLEAMVEETKKANIPFFIVTQLIDYPLDSWEVLAKDFKQQKDIVKKISLRNHNWSCYLRQVDALQIQNKVVDNYSNVKMINLYNELYSVKKSSIPLLYDIVHPVPNGNELIAKTLARQIKRYLTLKLAKID